MPADAGDGAAAVVLAAGTARRFGSPKLLMPFGGSSILGCVVGALELAGVHPIIVVAGAQAPAIAEALRGSAVQVICNPDPERGMVSSVRVGVAALPEGSERFLVCLADQPRVQADDILRLLREHCRLGKGIAIPAHRGKRGHPIVFHGRYREEIAALGDAQSLRDLVHSHAEDVVEVEFASEAVLRDIDTREQYRDEAQLAEQ